MKNYAVECMSEHAPRFADWIANRGGIAVWQSIDLSRPGERCTTPARDPLGNPATKPSWHYANDPNIVTDPEQVGVYEEALYKEFRVGLRMGSQGLSLKLTDGAQRKLNKVMADCEAKHGNAHYHKGVLPDAPASMGVYFTTGTMSLADWLKRPDVRPVEVTA
jgi:hypothetical protein